MKDYYNQFVSNDYKAYTTPIVVSFSGTTYSTMHNAISDKSYVILQDARLIALGEITILDKVYYRVILSNIVNELNSRSEYSNNIGYVLKDECTILENKVIHFTKYNNTTLTPGQYIEISKGQILVPYYDFSYYINEDGKVKIYTYFEDNKNIEDSDIYFK